MRAVIPLILLLLFILPQIYAEDTSRGLVYPGYWPINKIIHVEIIHPENGTIEIIEIAPVFLQKKTICQIHGKWKLSFEITNTNPYTVFVAIPDTVWCRQESLPYSEDFQKLYVSGVVATYVDNNTVILNGERGIWIPPYTTVKVQRRGIFVYNLNVSVVPDRHKIIGPALMDTTWVFDENFLEEYLRKYGIKVSNYRLLVDGKIVKRSDNTEILSMVIPAPLVLKEYDYFHKIVGKRDVDMWVSSYRRYINKHKMMSLKYNDSVDNTSIITVDTTLVPIIDNTVIPVVDDSLIPIIIKSRENKDADSKPFDVPAMVFTTDDGEFKSLKFSYVMYKD